MEQKAVALANSQKKTEEMLSINNPVTNTNVVRNETKSLLSKSASTSVIGEKSRVTFSSGTVFEPRKISIPEVTVIDENKEEFTIFKVSI